ncbi:serine/threonine protein kinase [Carpediemonas membranifera]|uniref:Serine/threonine protein kinase n=1 Tax=Carpediemonas membranifera TaxID=201153 RepID=A0A8J6BYI8_9EUKA|nr:serine/threonine protein kinase [Carpediemonas membranifera]|eukprot:KAG9394536.1 serine/threonine protein kinase [Carpediemonas membranifera]
MAIKTPVEVFHGGHGKNTRHGHFHSSRKHFIQSLTYWRQSMREITGSWEDDESRVRYMKSLFAIADQDGTKKIKFEELNDILAFFAKEGFDPSSFAFNIPAEATPDDIVRAVMDEYDYGRTGYLTEEEFMALTDTVLKEYQLHQDYAGIINRTIGPYNMTRTLGYGTMGIVKFATHKETGKAVAIKVIRRANNYVDEVMIDAEIEAHETITGHPYIVSFVEALETDSHVFFIMELCGGGSVLDHILHTPFTEAITRFYLRQVAEGLVHMHECGVAHRDLRLENVLLDNEGNVKICDFGHALIFNDGWDAFTSQTRAGSLFSQAPEQIGRNPCSGRAVDVWSLGVVMHCLLLNRRPFVEEGMDQMRQLKAIANAELSLPEDINPDAADLLRQLLAKDPKARPTVSEALEHPWFDGPVHKPAIAFTELDMTDIPGHTWDEDIAGTWKTMLDVLGTFPLDISTPPEPLCDMHVRLVHRENGVHLGLTFMPDEEGDMTFGFYLWRGECWQFQRVSKRIITNFLDWVMKNGNRES